MSNFLQAREGTVVNLEQVATIFHDVSDFNSVSGHKKSVIVHLVGGTHVQIPEDDPAYHAWLTYMERRQTLANYNAIQVQSEYFDPFLDQMPTTLFTVFQSLHGSDEMTMELHNDGAGVVWRGKADQVEVLAWSNFDEGLRKLQEYGKTLAEESQKTADLP